MPRAEKKQKKSPRPCDLGLNPPKEEGGGDNLGKTNSKETRAVGGQIQLAACNGNVERVTCHYFLELAGVPATAFTAYCEFPKNHFVIR